LRWIAVLGVVLVGLSGLDCLAEEGGQDSFQLEDVVVSAPEEAPEYVQDVITKEKIDTPTVSDSVLNSLKDLAGVQLMRGSIAGSESSKLRLRGFGETRLRILVDGDPLQRDGSYGIGPVDWSLLSSEDVEQIEVFRGVGPAKFGNTLGGVVNIITKKPTEERETSVSSVYGSLDTWDSKISHRWKMGPVGWDLGASHYETDGYLRNNFFERENFSGKVVVDLPLEFELGVGIRYSDTENGMPVYNMSDSPYYDSDDPDAIERELIGPSISSRLKDGVYGWGDGSVVDGESAFYNVNLSKKFESGRVRLSYLLWNEETTEVYYDADDSNKKIYERKTKAEDGNWQLLGDAEYELGLHKIGVGGEFREYGWGDQDVLYIDENAFTAAIRYLPYYKDGFKGQPRRLSLFSLYAQDVWRIHPKVDLELGLREEIFKARKIDPDAFGYSHETDVTSMEEQHLDPRFAATVRPWKGGSIQGRLGVVHRYPTSPEYFWWYLNKSTQFFNEDLEIEEAFQYELALEQSLFGFMTGVIRGYYYEVDDYISSTTVQGVGQVVYNIDDVTIKGVELGLRADLSHGFGAWANLTLQEADKDGDPWDAGNALTAELPDLPEEMFNFGIDYRYKDAVTARLSINHVASREHITDNEIVELDPYTLVNLSASYRFPRAWWGRWEVLFAVENMLDEDYEEEEGYPMPGATVIGGLRVSF
jgi:outer membrane receptor protein involved in Fe transport